MMADWLLEDLSLNESFRQTWTGRTDGRTNKRRLSLIGLLSKLVIKECLHSDAVRALAGSILSAPKTTKKDINKMLIRECFNKKQSHARINIISQNNFSNRYLQSPSINFNNIISRWPGTWASHLCVVGQIIRVRHKTSPLYPVTWNWILE